MLNNLNEVSYYNCGKVIHGDFQQIYKCPKNVYEDMVNYSEEVDNTSTVSSDNNSAISLDGILTIVHQKKEGRFLIKGNKMSLWGMIYVEKGALVNVVDGINYRVNEDEILFYSEEQKNIQWMGVNTPVSFYTVIFDMDFRGNPCLKNKKILLDFELKELFNKIISESHENDYYADDIISCYLKEFVIKLLRNEKQKKSLESNNSELTNEVESSIVSKSIEFIHQNIGKKITVADIAKAIPVSQSYLSMVFKKHVNKTIIEYTNDLKLEESKRLIRSSKYNFTEIADILGYNSIHYFSNRFKLKYGVNPSKYASNIRKLHTVV